MSNPLQQIKQKQIAAAIEKGEQNPYLTNATVQPGHATKVPNKLRSIKAKQLEANPELYGVDMASGTDVHSAVGLMTGATLSTGKLMFEQLQAGMETDIARIKGVPDLEDKQAIKRDLLPAYLPFVNDYMANGHNYPCDVAVRVMIWLFDINDIENALRIGLYLVKTDSKPPVKWTRTLEDIVTDAVYDWSGTQLKAGHSASPYLDQLMRAILAEKWDMHPLMLMKTFSMLAKHKFREDNHRDCLDLCVLAENVNPEKSGVKGLKAKTLKAIELLPPETGVSEYIRREALFND